MLAAVRSLYRFDHTLTSLLDGHRGVETTATDDRDEGNAADTTDLLAGGPP